MKTEALLVWRQWRQRPGRALLTLSSIAIAVAAVASVVLATQTARDAFNQLVESSAGSGALDVLAANHERFPLSQVALLQSVDGIEGWMPVLHRPSVVRFQGKRIQLVVVGVDQNSAPERARFQWVAGREPRAANEAVLETAFAESIGANVGDRLLVLHRRGVSGLDVCGIATTASSLTVSESGVLFLPLNTVERLFALPGMCDVVRVFPRDRHVAERVESQLQADLPAGFEVRRRLSRTQISEQSLLATEQGLLFIVALGVAMSLFIVLNTFLMNVTERRKQLAILRAIGATTRQVRRMLLTEAALMGLAGAVIGIGLGLVGARGIGMAVSGTMHVGLPQVSIDPRLLLMAGLAGPFVALAAAWWPVHQAGRIGPLESLAIVPEAQAERFPRRVVIAAGTMFVVSGTLLAMVLQEWVSPRLAIGAGVLMLASAVLLVPVVLVPLTELASHAMASFWPVESLLARVQLLRRRWRTVLTLGVLVVAISNAIGMGSAVFDNIDDVREWHRRALTGDFFLVSLGTQPAASIEQGETESLPERLAALPGVTGTDAWRLLTGTAGDLPVAIIVRPFPLDRPLPLEVIAGDPDTALAQVHEGAVFIGPALAQRLGVKPGDSIQLQAQGKMSDLPVAAVIEDYSSGGLSVVLQRDVAQRLFGIQGADMVSVMVDDAHRDEVRRQVEAIAEAEGKLFRSLDDVMAEMEILLQGVVASFWALLLVSCCVAAFGVANTLAMNVQEQTQEVGLLRTIGMTRRQVRTTILLQATILAAIGALLGAISGLITAWMIGLCVKPILGHTIEFHWRYGLWGAVLVGAVLVTLAAATLPARRAARLNLLEAIAWE